MQLDIFEHSRDLMLRNDVLHALLRRDAVVAGNAWSALANEYPQDSTLAPLRQLVAALEQPLAPAWAEHASASDALQALRADIEPAARQLLGDKDGHAWLAPLWQQLAQRAAGLAFRPEQSEVHAAPLFLHAGDAAAAAHAVAGIESWRRIPAPLSWMAEARWYRDGLDSCWGLLAELAWLAPARFDDLTRRLPDPVLRRQRRQFDTQFEGDGSVADLAWFPAWVLTDKPALAAALGESQPGMQTAPERALRLLIDLLHLERQGRQRELVAQRRRLRELQPALFRAYMASR
jgi:hypothetical protein